MTSVNMKFHKCYCSLLILSRLSFVYLNIFHNITGLKFRNTLSSPGAFHDKFQSWARHSLTEYLEFLDEHRLHSIVTNAGFLHLGRNVLAKNAKSGSALLDQLY